MSAKQRRGHGAGITLACALGKYKCAYLQIFRELKEST
jgi:hypothetical protein